MAQNLSNKRDEWVIIGISGVTCGGKTTLSNRLKDSISPVYVFHQDKYFYPDDSPHHVKCKELEHNNYDILSSLDMETMYKDILDTMHGENKAHSSSTVPGRFEVKGKKFLVIEGFIALNYKPILEICDFRYYFVLEYNECVSRRSRRNYEPPDIPGYFQLYAWPEHIRYRSEIEKDSRVKIVDGAQCNDAIFQTVMADLRTMST